MSLFNKSLMVYCCLVMWRQIGQFQGIGLVEILPETIEYIYCL